LTGWHLRRAARTVFNDGIIAYPAEAVYGLGCDPLAGAAVARLAALKRRSLDKGFILIGADFEQLAPYLLPLSGTLLARMHATWPGAVTWAAPARPGVPAWLTGGRETLAVRVPGNATARELCRFAGPLVSSSANITGRPAARTALGVLRRFGEGVDFILHGDTAGRGQPSRILDAVTGATLR